MRYCLSLLGPVCLSQALTSFTLKNMKKHQSYDFEVESIQHNGKGLSHSQGVPTTLPYTLPGQLVRARVTKKKGGKAEARIQQLLRPRPDEVLPFCQHFGQPPTEDGRGCGGCQWQQIPYRAQLKIKQELIESLLKPLLPDLPINPIIPSPQERNYRNKVEMSFGDKNYISDARYLAMRAAGEPLATGAYLGFHVPGSFGTVIDIQRCELIPRPLQLMHETVHQVWPSLGGEPYNSRHHTGFWRHLILRMGLRSGEIMVHLNTTDSHSVDWAPLLKALNEVELDGARLHSVLHSVHTGDAQIVGYETPRVLQGASTIHEEICGLRFEIAPYAFFQTNTYAAEQLYEQIARLARLEDAPRVYDLYSGTGSIGMLLAKRGAREVFGLEEIESAVDNARANAEANGLTNCFFRAGKVEKMLESLLLEAPPDLVIVDPPRAGLHPKVVKRLCALELKQLIYVSCNPGALARDLETLLSVYDVKEVQPVDLFPQTGHMETLVHLALKS